MRSPGLFLPVVAVALVGAAGQPDGAVRSTAPRGQSANRIAAASASQCRDIVFTQVPARHRTKIKGCPGYSSHARFGQGGRLVLLARDGSSRILTPDFESAADPAVSFDGERILFAGKRRASERWNIYEMKADGSAVRQITHDLGDCRSPIYQSPIFYLDDPGPMPQIAFVSDAPSESGEHGPAPATAIYSARLDGSGVRRLTYNPSGAFDPTMLPDGRILFSAWQGADPGRAPRGRIALLGINIDGTDYAAFSGAQGRRVQLMACVTSRRQVVFVDADSTADDGAGPLATIDLRRNLHSYRRLTPPAEGAFLSPSPLPDGAVLVARRPAGGPGTYGIYRLDPATHKLGLVFDAADSHDVQPQALVPREVPDGRSSVVDEKQDWARLYCLNLKETDIDSGLWAEADVRRIRILEGLPRPASDAADCLSNPHGATADSLSPMLQKRFVGEIDPDEDGSFNVQIPANTPVQIQALDANGMALRTSAWIWAKNKEQRGCIGCHEDGERTPENVMVTALTRMSIKLMLPPERRRTVEFERDVAPILARSCASAACHGGVVRPKFAGKGAGFSAAYESLLAKTPTAAGKPASFKYVTPGSARTSPLIWAVFGRNMSRPWDAAARGAATPRPMPPSGAGSLTESEKRAIIEWIDLGAHYRGHPGNGKAAEGGGR